MNTPLPSSLPTPDTSPSRSWRDAVSPSVALEDHSSDSDSYVPSSEDDRSVHRSTRKRRRNQQRSRSSQPPTKVSRRTAQDKGKRTEKIPPIDLYRDITNKGRNPILGRVYECLVLHPKIKYERDVGKVYIIVLDLQRDAMKEMHKWCANQSVAGTNEERDAMGFFPCRPNENDFVFWRNKFGSGRPEEDILKAFSVSKKDYTTQKWDGLCILRKDVVGPNHYEGKSGIRIEQLGIKNLAGSDRSYPVGVSYQTIPNLEGPSSNSKWYGNEMDEGRKIQKRMMEAGAEAGVLGLSKIISPMHDILKNQAELTNCTRLGSQENVFWTTGQINVASLKMKDVEYQRVSSSNPNIISDLGQFGKAHHDGGDSEAAFTNMTNFTPPHPDVHPEYFTIIDLGCYWRLDEFCSIFFSGIHYHGGSPAIAKDSFDGSAPYTRITFIMYPSGNELDGDSRVALAGVDMDTRNGLLTLTHRMRNAIPRSDTMMETCESGNYFADGLAFMDESSYLNHVARSTLLLNLFMVRQAPMTALLRINRRKFLESFSMVVGGSRTAAADWNVGPGWTGGDVEIGKTYENLDGLNGDELRLKWNSDSMSETVYGNTEISQQQQAWSEWKKLQRETFPLCYASGEMEVADNEPAFNYRRTMRSSALKNAIASGSGSGGGSGEAGEKGKKTSKKSALKNAIESGSGSGGGSGEAREKRKKTSKKSASSLKLPTYTDISLFKSLQVSALQGELERIQFEIDLSSEAEPIPLPETSNLFDLALACRTLDEHQAFHASQVRPIRQDRLLINMLLQELICGMKMTTLSNVDHPNVKDSFTHLTMDIQNWYQVQAEPLTLSSSDYIISSSPSPQTYTLVPGRSGSYVDDVVRVAADRAELCMLSWLGINNTEGGRRAALFTRLMVNKLGVEVLAVENIWRCSHHLSERVMGEDNSLTPSPIQLESQINRLFGLFDNIDSTQKLVQLIHHASFPIRSTGAQKYFPDLETAVLQCKNSPLLPIHSTHTPSRSPSHSPARSHSLSPSPSKSPSPDTLSSSKTFTDWVGQLKLCLRCLDNERTLKCRLPPSSSCSPPEFRYLSEIMLNPDQYFPFRDFAPSRHRLLSSGVFNSDNLRTRHGFFSVLIARGLTHSTNFLLDYSPLFTDLAHFEHVRDQAAEEQHFGIDTQYFCKPGAYGRPNPQVKIVHASVYWDSSGKDQFNSWLLRGTPMSFHKLIKLFASDGKAFPAIGPLRAFQIAVDYVKAGVITPTHEDFLRGLREVNAGGVAGLRILHLLPQVDKSDGRKAKLVDMQALTLAFDKVTKWLEKSWNSDDYQWDQYDVEHWLCKISTRRLGRKSYQEIKM